MKSVKELMNLKSRVAVVTGGAGHIGPALAEALAECGASIALVDVNGEQCRRNAENIKRKYRVKVLALATDLTREHSVRALPSAVVKHFGRMDILVNCAALVGSSNVKGWAVPFEKQNLDTWRLALEVNLTSVFALAQASTKFLSKSRQGSIINIGSIYGMVGPYMGLYKGTKLGNPAAYSASKGGLLQLTRWLATALAPKVRVNTMTLGGVFRGHPQKFVSRYRERTPVNRMAREEDFKGAVVYLASDLSNYVTGHNLVVDGGWTAW